MSGKIGFIHEYKFDFMSLKLKNATHLSNWKKKKTGFLSCQ